MSNPRKVMHKVFKMNLQCELWIEDHGDHHALMMKTSLAQEPSETQTFADLSHAIAGVEGFTKMMSPDIVEGSLKDISEFDNHRKKKNDF